MAGFSGHQCHLVDVSEKLLEASADRLEGQGLGGRIAGRHHQSATDLSTYEMERPTFSWPLVRCITSENSTIDADQFVKRREC